MAINTITYTDKVALNVNADVPDINKVKADDMNEIKNVVNNNANGVGDITTLKTNDTTDLVSGVNSIIDAEVYSTTEVKTNKVWTDGKPIYRKVITGTKNSGWTDVDISSTDFDSIYIDNSATHFIFTAGTSTFNKPDYYLSSNDYITAQIEPSQKRISIGAGSQLSNIQYIIVIEYTKTTD